MKTLDSENHEKTWVLLQNRVERMFQRKDNLMIHEKNLCTNNERKIPFCIE